MSRHSKLLFFLPANSILQDTFVPLTARLNLETARVSATTSTLEFAALGQDMGFLLPVLVLKVLNRLVRRGILPCAGGDRSRSA